LFSFCLLFVFLSLSAMGAQLQVCGSICSGDPVGARELQPSKAGARELPPSKAENIPGATVDWASNGRVAGTPILDEGFICMGSKAPICPPPPTKQNTGPITMETVQGAWVGSGGVQITVFGTDVMMNGMPLRNKKVELRDDGTVLSIGNLWQLDGWSPEGGLEFRCTSTRVDMHCAKLEVWSRKQLEGVEEERLRLMGYAGSAANPLARGVEGCLPGTTGAEMREDPAKSKKEVALLGALIGQWREPELVKVKPYFVVPDFTNRAQTGLGVELIHFIATSIRSKGFQKRVGTQGHDIPVVVREPPTSDFQEEALRVWKERVSEEEGFPPVRASSEDEIFTSLGNGHFFQALNCYGCGIRGINGQDVGTPYVVGQDASLAEALAHGVPSIVLQHTTPRPVRAKIAELLNSKRDHIWTLGSDGSVDVSKLDENDGYCSQFEWLSKGMDAVQVDCLVRSHLGVRNSKRIMG